MTGPERDLIVIGRGPTALSLAAEAGRSGIRDVLLLVPGEHTLPTNGPGRFGLSVSYGFSPERIEEIDDRVVVENDQHSHRARVAVRVVASVRGGLDIPTDDAVAGRIHREIDGFDSADKDVLVIGGCDTVVEDVLQLLDSRARVVLAFEGSAADLSPVASMILGELEHQRKITVLWSSFPDAITEVSGLPMIHFDDRRTPDLAFDEILVRSYLLADAGEGKQRGRLFEVSPSAPADHPLNAQLVSAAIRDEFPELVTIQRSSPVPERPSQEDIALRAKNYNATITRFDPSHEDLWVIRVRADRPDTGHLPGQYATLGLGYWERRADDADEGLTDDKRTKMIRRSYSISGQVFDDVGYLWDPREHDEIEFYIVHVRPEGDQLPGLTPRLALKHVGDRIYLGPKIAGRYTLAPVNDPTLDVVFLATGTGEAPHNTMIPELLRKGHIGSIVSVVTIRYLRDLGYTNVHRRLEERFSNYRYVVLPTREDGYEKRYIQDLITSGELATQLDSGLDPAGTHVFLCGNPRMIGLPKWDDDRPIFPEEVGVTGLLHDRGFTVDRRGRPGNVHYEEYW